MKARDYQVACRKSVMETFKQHDSTLIVLATGLGKTNIACDIIRNFFPRRTMFLAHRRELIWQSDERLKQLTGFRTAIEMGEYKANTGVDMFSEASAPQVIVSSVQTHATGSSGGRMGKFNPMHYGLLVIDEAHHATSLSYQRIIAYYKTNPRLKILGVTATPDRTDEEALGQVFKSVSYEYNIRDGIKNGWLVPVYQQMVNIESLDFSKVKSTKAGDLNGAELDKVMRAEKPLLGIADATLSIVGNEQTLLFAASVEHARMLCDIFNRYKPGSATYVHAKTDKDERRVINSDFNSGKIQILCNYGTHTEGFDSPRVRYVIMGRPTESRLLYEQMAGRGTRPLPGTVDKPHLSDNATLRKEAIANSDKPCCTIVDFVGNSGRHKLICTADILGGNVSERVIDRAIIHARKTGKPVAMDDLLDEEARMLQKEDFERRRMEESRKRASLVAKAKYSSTTVDPFDTLQIAPTTEKGWDKGKHLSEKQAQFLKRSGINPDKLQYQQGKQLINEIMSRHRTGTCTFGQAKVLRKYGYETNMPREVASQLIDRISNNGWRRPDPPEVTRPIMPPTRRPVKLSSDDVPF